MIQASKALQRGDVEALIYERAILGHMIKEYGWRELHVLPHTLAVRDYAIALPTDSPIKEPINRALLKVVHRPDWKDSCNAMSAPTDQVALADKPVGVSFDCHHAGQYASIAAPRSVTLEGGRIVKTLAVLSASPPQHSPPFRSCRPAPKRSWAPTASRAPGSTFAYPIISKWAKGYQRWVAGGGDYPIAGSGLDDPPTGPLLDYEPTGSLAGTMRVKEAAVDFGASDVPLKSGGARKLGLGQFPIVIGGVVAVVNIDGVGPGEIKFTGELLADIYLGKIQSWADPAIKALNPGPQAARRQDRRCSSLRRLRHDLQLHGLSVQGEPAMAGEGRLRPARAVAGRHRRQGQ